MVAAAISISTTIISAEELTKKAGEVNGSSLCDSMRCPALSNFDWVVQIAAEHIPEPPKNLEEKFRWLHATVKNETQFNISFMHTMFDSGRYWEAPGSIDSFKQMSFSCCNGDHTVLTGVSGGNSFRLSLDDKHFLDFALVTRNYLFHWMQSYTHRKIHFPGLD